jgi:hypothetical protein
LLFGQKFYHYRLYGVLDKPPVLEAFGSEVAVLFGDQLVKPLMQLDDGFLHVLILCIAEPGLRTAR